MNGNLSNSKPIFSRAKKKWKQRLKFQRYVMSLVTVPNG